jgi:uncharacterized protein (TIGR03067 family)
MSASMASLLLVLAWAAPTAKAERADSGDLARLQGHWIAKAGPKKGLQVDLRIDGKIAKVKVTTVQGLSIQAEGEIRIDTTSRPKSLDWVNFTTLDDERVPEMLAIYELVGETFRVCNAGPNNARPSEFKPGEGVLADLVVFERKLPRTDEKSTERAESSTRAGKSHDGG